MESLIFVRPTEADCAAISAYRAEHILADEPFCGAGRLAELADPLAWLQDVAAKASLETLPAGLVLSTQFICKRANSAKILGMLDVRHSLNDYLMNFGGHIGYAVAPSERRQGYAKWMLQQALVYCRAIGLSRVLITCTESNLASKKTIISCGGVYEDSRLEPNKKQLMQRYWIELA